LWSKIARGNGLVTMANIAEALAQIDEWVSPGGVPAVGAAVWHRGRVVAERYAGEARPGRPVDAASLFGLASITKPVTAAAVMALVEDGLIALDEPVIEVVPEFATAEGSGEAVLDPAREARRGEITVRQLLCHLAGLPEDLGPRRVRFADAPDLATLVDAMCRLPLQSAPGEVLRYSNAGYAVLTRLTERLSGEEFWAFTRRRVTTPLGLADEIVARPDSRQSARIVHLAEAAGAGTPTESYNSAYWRELAIPWGGLYGTPRLAHFAGSFLPGFMGRRPLSAATVSLMIADQAGGVPGGVETGKVWWPVAAWGLGWEVKGVKRRHWTGELTSPDAFCHFGQAGTLLWGDPAHDLALAVFTGRAVTRMWGFILTRWIKLSNALVAVVSHES
jgi:CubicO group peptidase (beta-lactamase class C family)